MKKTKGRCVYNKKELRKSTHGICYYCLETFRKEEITATSKEELKCPNCKMKSILPVNKPELITSYWVTKLSELFYD